MIHLYLERKKELIDREISAFIKTNFVGKYEEKLTEPLKEILENKGKRLRPLFCQLMYDCFCGKNPEINKISIIPELIHSGSLIIDDIEDSSELRRGKKTIHKIYGIPLSINAGNLIYFFPSSILNHANISRKKKALILKYINECLTKLHIGQGMDIYWSENKIYDISVDDYLKMCAYKTGALIALSLKLGALLANKSRRIQEKMDKLGSLIGIAFQIQDDLLNINSDKNLGKDWAEDITEGKRTFLVIHTLENANEKDKNKLIKILNSNVTSKKELVAAIKIMNKYSSIKKAELFSDVLIRKAKILGFKLIKHKRRKLFFDFLEVLEKRQK